MNTAVGQPGAGIAHAVELPGHVQPALGGDFLTAFGHQADHLRPHAADDVEHLRRQRRLEVQRHGDGGLEPLDVGVADVAAVLA
jgi:hypothetical protein